LGPWADGRDRLATFARPHATAEATTAWLAKRDERARAEGAKAERERIAKGLVGMAEWLEGCVAASVEIGLSPQADQDGRAKGLREAVEYVASDWGISARADEADNDS
jgi:hypothetical protein